MNGKAFNLGNDVIQFPNTNDLVLDKNYKYKYQIVWLLSLIPHVLSFEEGKTKWHASNNYK